MSRILYLATVSMLAALLLAASPALAQQAEQSPQQTAQERLQQIADEDEEVTLTGVIQSEETRFVLDRFFLVDEQSGVDRTLASLGPDEGGVVLSELVGERVRITGIPQTLGNPPSTFEDINDLTVLITSLETLESGSGGGGVLVEASGVLEDPQATSYQYGEYAITDEQSGSTYALQSDSVDLSKYVGQQVSVTGRTVKGYPVDNGPPLLNVTEIGPSGDTSGGTGGNNGGPAADLDCIDFSTQAEAQATYDADPSDPNGLDADNDGIACETTIDAQDAVQYEDDTGFTIGGPTGNGNTNSGDQYTNGGTTGGQSTDGDVTVLPDTGGLPLGGIAAGLGVALVAGGLLVRKRLS